MFNFIKKKKQPQTIEYNPDIHQAVIKASICNGEQVAGFRNVTTGEFTEVMFIKNDSDIDCFKKLYGVSAISREYW